MIEVNISKSNAGYCELKCCYGMILLKNWVVDEITYKGRLVQVIYSSIPAEQGVPKEIIGPCRIITGYVTVKCSPFGNAKNISSPDERKELSDLLGGAGKVLFSCHNLSVKLLPENF